MTTTSQEKFQLAISSELAREVEARNKLNGRAAEIFGHLADILYPYIGRKVVKVTPYQTWVKVLADAISSLHTDLHSEGFRLVFEFYSHSIHAKLTYSYQVPGVSYSHFIDCSFNLCSLERQTLKSLASAPDFRKYCPREITEARQAVSALKEQIRELESRLGAFSK